ncbi:MAG: hypothetical protein II098_04540 [Treponema sp.]|nr:hypothetical protein [Treponema sp.]
MKKIAAAVILSLFAAGGMFAVEANIETGLTFGGAAREVELEGYLAETRDKVSTSIAGVYVAGDLELNKYFGLFTDLALTGSFNTSDELTMGLSGNFNWADPNYKVTSFGSILFGAEYILNLGDSIKIKLGGGFDAALSESKANGIYIDPNNLINNRAIVLMYSDWTRRSALLGLGTKAKVNFDLNKHFGFNAGLVFDWYFLSLGETKTKGMFSATASGNVLLENTFVCRPEVGVTFRFGAEENK